MKKKLLMILFIIIIVFFLIFNFFIKKSTDECTIYDYTYKEYYFSIDDEFLWEERLKGYNLFEKFEEQMLPYSEIHVANDTRHGRAWGEIIFFFDEECEEQLKFIISNLFEINGDSRGFGTIDEIGSISIERFSGVSDGKVRLIFSVSLPRYFNSFLKYNKYEQFFLNLLSCYN